MLNSKIVTSKFCNQQIVLETLGRICQSNAAIDQLNRLGLIDEWIDRCIELCNSQISKNYFII